MGAAPRSPPATRCHGQHKDDTGDRKQNVEGCEADARAGLHIWAVRLQRHAVMGPASTQPPPQLAQRPSTMALHIVATSVIHSSLGSHASLMALSASHLGSSRVSWQ